MIPTTRCKGFATRFERFTLRYEFEYAAFDWQIPQRVVEIRQRAMALMACDKRVYERIVTWHWLNSMTNVPHHQNNKMSSALKLCTRQCTPPSYKW